MQFGIFLYFVLPKTVQLLVLQYLWFLLTDFDHFIFILLKNRFLALVTTRSQPTWIKFCTHLLLYGIHLWADLDHDRRMGGSRSNQNDYVFL